MSAGYQEEEGGGGGTLSAKWKKTHQSVCENNFAAIQR